MIGIRKSNMSDEEKFQMFMGAAIVATLLGLGGLANWLIQQAVSTLVEPYLFLAQCYTFASTLPTPLNTIGALVITGVLIVFGIGVFGTLASICGVVSHIVRH